MRLFVVSRHAESEFNVAHRVNGNPATRTDLTEAGRAQAAALGLQLGQLPLDLAVHTRFPRTRQTIEVALAGREVPLHEEPLLDDVDVGELDGAPIEEYRTVKRGLGRTRPFPGGESLDAAAARYARGYRALLEREERCVLVVCHEIPLRYALNGAAGSDRLDGPVHELENARPYLFDGDALARAVERIEELAALGARTS